MVSGEWRVESVASHPRLVHVAQRSEDAANIEAGGGLVHGLALAGGVEVGDEERREHGVEPSGVGEAGERDGHEGARR